MASPTGDRSHPTMADIARLVASHTWIGGRRSVAVAGVAAGGLGSAVALAAVRRGTPGSARAGYDSG